MCLFACLGLTSLAQAQSAITGTVRDPSGAVLPGVTVEAASPVLIEKVKSAVTDAAGEYRIGGPASGHLLRPSSHCSGFTILRREEIELPANFTASLNADLRIGGIEESVTVSGASPVVDVQSTERRSNLSREVLDALPTARSYRTMGRRSRHSTSGAGRFDVGGSTSMWQSQLAALEQTGAGHGYQHRRPEHEHPIRLQSRPCGYPPETTAPTRRRWSTGIGGGSAETRTPGVCVEHDPA